MAMEDDASEEQLQQAAAKAVKASEDGKLHGLVKRLKKAFTVKLNDYTLEMVREPGRGVDIVKLRSLALTSILYLYQTCIIYSPGEAATWSGVHRRGRICSWR